VLEAHETSMLSQALLTYILQVKLLNLYKGGACIPTGMQDCHRRRCLKRTLRGSSTRKLSSRWTRCRRPRPLALHRADLLVLCGAAPMALLPAKPLEPAVAGAAPHASVQLSLHVVSCGSRV
jgi:hypothetical protein